MKPSARNSRMATSHSKRRPSRSHRARLRREGAAYVEFLVVFPIVLMFFLALIQLSLLFVARLSVHHAATRAARSAVVVIPDDPAHYSGGHGDEPAYALDPDTTSDSSSLIDGFSALGLLLSFGHSDDGSLRLNTIRTAAYVPMIPLAPDMLWLIAPHREETLGRAFEAGISRLSGIVYAKGATAVTFYNNPGDPASDMIWTFDRRQALTTRVTYLYYCPIPLVKQWICTDIGGLALDSIFGSGDAPQELRYTASPIMPLLHGFVGGGRFVPLRAEVTLPIQGASYDYH